MSAENELVCLWKNLTKQKPCNKNFKSIDEIVFHINDKHVSGREGSNGTCFWMDCPRNGRPLKDRYKLIEHMRIHTGEKPFQCSFPGCDKWFSKLSNLNVHKRRHKGDKPFKCLYCKKRFITSCSMNRHLTVHTGEKPYVCTVKGCDKKYTQVGSLRKHRKKHHNLLGSVSRVGRNNSQQSPPLSPEIILQTDDQASTISSGSGYESDGNSGGGTVCESPIIRPTRRSPPLIIRRRYRKNRLAINNNNCQN